MITQPVFTCSKLTTETLEQGVKYVYSKLALNIFHTLPYCFLLLTLLEHFDIIKLPI